VTKKPNFYLDSDIFIAAKNSYYAFSICPGFWNSLIHHNGKNRVFSIDRIRQELLAGNESEDLVVWTKNQLPDGFFLKTQTTDIFKAYTEIIQWATSKSQYDQAAKDEFARVADGWLVAYAMVNGGVIVTNEQPRPKSVKRILLPDVCLQFNIAYQNTFTMLKELEVAFDWSDSV
jgi:hypothetical protein